MRRLVPVFFLLAVIPFIRIPAQAGEETHPTEPIAPPPVRHDLRVTLDPAGHSLSVVDDLTLPEDVGETLFRLHPGLDPVALTAGVRVETVGNPATGRYRIIFEKPARRLRISYQGEIYHPLDSPDREYARGMRQTSGIIAEEGVYLAGSSSWYPKFDTEDITFRLRVTAPDGWTAVSQGNPLTTGTAPGGNGWETATPQDEIYLIAGPFTVYSRTTETVHAMAFLRTPDTALAERYLEATERYIAMYNELIGEYPYGKFALVENFWETGWGMPSFTLLGPRIIRMPFILVSSYPHEILHNWWGNGVYPDYARGNWSEGLTAYLADHLLKEQKGRDRGHRQTVLQKYLDYVRDGNEIPLARFTSRHSSASEAVGYGKALMMFHMLRRNLGDATFKQGLREFYRRFLFKTASFDDLRESFEEVSGRDFDPFFDQWVHRTGAPGLRLTNVSRKKENREYVITGRIRQDTAEEKPFRLNVPVSVTVFGRDEPVRTTVTVNGRDVPFRITVPGRPLRIDVDPGFDLFRRLDPAEIPPALSALFGAKSLLVILPEHAGELRAAYETLARALERSGPDTVDTVLDRDLDTLPEDRAVFVLGWENRFAGTAQNAVSPYGPGFGDSSFRIGNTELPRTGHALVFAGTRAGGNNNPIAFAGLDLPDAATGLGRKLPHYGKYSYLAFRGDEPANVLKGRWPVLDSPLSVRFEKDAPPAPRIRSTPLAELPPVFSASRMLGTVAALADPALEGRGPGSPGSARAADMITRNFEAIKLVPGGDAGYVQSFTIDGGGESPVVLRNIIGIVPGTNPAYAGQSVVVGAHYDHLGRGLGISRESRFEGRIHPGADDNASGVAVLIELARYFAGTAPERTIVFAAFSGEETGRLGSKHYVSAMKRFPPAKTIGMINLDTVGRLGDRKLLVLGAESADEWVHIFRGAGYVTGVDVTTVTEPLDSSDQVSFHEARVPAVQLFAGPHEDYHRPTDSVDRIDASGLVNVAAVATEAIEYLASRPTPLTGRFADNGSESKHTAPRNSRTASLGTIPDFAYTGKGCRISGIMPGSPAESCGLLPGDVIIRIDDTPIKGLRDLSVALKNRYPGDRIVLTVLRKGVERDFKAVLRGR